MTDTDPTDSANPSETRETPPPEPAGNDAAETSAEGTGTGVNSASETPRQRILIGSQRDPAAYRARRRRDWIPLPEPDAEQPAAQDEKAPPKEDTSQPDKPPREEEAPEETSPEPAAQKEMLAALDVSEKPAPSGHFPPPNIREKLSPDLEEEYDKALGPVLEGEEAALEDLLAGGDALSRQSLLEPESQHTGRVAVVRRDDVFVELGGREQGIVSLKQFDEPPKPGTPLEVIVQRFNPEDGLYELTIPDATVKVDDWADLREGMLVEARVIGHNSGGLECEVNHLRGFIPISQVSLYRVEDLGQFVDEKFTCLVTEANPQRRNLVLSRRAVLEREKEEARQKLLDSLQPGQIHEGVVRKLVDFGAFVDLGGIDGLLHISQLAWGRVNHPSEVLTEGQTIKVKIEKIDHATGKMSLAYREMLENPWDNAAKKYPVNSVVRGTVSKLMEFGAFVELEPGVEGLVHISELSHKRVWRTGDVVHEGDEVEVLVLSVDPEAQRISLSMKAVAPPPQPAKKEEEPDSESAPAKPSKRTKPDKPLKGGLGRTGGGQQFGLKW